MNRAWAAVAIVVIVIVGVIAVEVASRGRGARPSGQQPVATVIGQKTSTAGPAIVKTPPPKEPPEKIAEPETPKPPVEPQKPEPQPDVKKPEPGPPGPSADSVVKAAEAQSAAGKKIEAQKLLSDALSKGPVPANPEPMKALLGKLNDEIFFSKVSPLAKPHVVKEKEVLETIAKQYKTTVEVTQRVNSLKDPNLIVLGHTLKVIPGAFDIEVSKGKFLLTVFKGGIWVREYKVGLGKDRSTPEGQFVAGSRIKDPPYTGVVPNIPASDHKNNPLGTRWISIEGAGKDYGIHGTWEPDSIGKESSKGCIRMRNEDVQSLFELIVPGESKITIKP